MSPRQPDVLAPTSPEEAARAFGDGDGITVLGGGTILIPELTDGSRKPQAVLMLGGSRLDGISRENGVVTIGATTSLSALEGLEEPLGAVARHVADGEIRAQATVGGNLCAEPRAQTPRGDLQAPLIALGARVRSTGAGGERVEDLEDFLAAGGARLVLDVSYDDVERKTGYAAANRPHAHHYTILAVTAVRTNGDLRVAATGAAPKAVRLRSVERSGNPGDALQDADLRDDALASAWYRERVLPGLVAKAIAGLG